MEAARSFKILVSHHIFTRHHKPEDCDLNSKKCQISGEESGKLVHQFEIHISTAVLCFPGDGIALTMNQS
jgi:hypothetical protein